MKRHQKKQILLEAGMAYIIEHGYHHSGLNEILATVHVPKGSFYFYFTSKEDFALQVLTYFAENTRARLQRFLDDESMPPLERLRRYFEDTIDSLVLSGFRQGCLIGNLGEEMADLNEVMRQHIDAIMQQWAAQIGDCLQKAQQQGHIAAGLDPLEMGSICLNCWQGALLRMKVTKDAQPLRGFIHLFFDVLLSQKEFNQQ